MVYQYILATTLSSKKELKLGFLISWSSKSLLAYRYAGAVTRVVDDINRDKNLLSGTTVTFVHGDSGCSDIKGLGATVDLYYQNISAFIGPPCSSSCLSGGLLSTYKEIPMISYGCSSIELSDTGKYKFFARTKPFARGSKKWTPQTFVAIMKYFKWKTGCLIESAHDIYTPLAKETAGRF